MPPGDEMDMRMIDRLPCGVAAIHSDVKASHATVSTNDRGTERIKQQVDGAPLWLKKIEEGRCVPPRDQKGVQRRHGVSIPDRHGERV